MGAQAVPHKFAEAGRSQQERVIPVPQHLHNPGGVYIKCASHAGRDVDAIRMVSSVDVPKGTQQRQWVFCNMCHLDVKARIKAATLSI